MRVFQCVIQRKLNNVQGVIKIVAQQVVIVQVEQKE